MPSLPGCCTSSNAADIATWLVSREVAMMDRLRGWVATSRPRTASLPAIGSTIVVMNRSGPRRSAYANACRLGKCARGRRFWYRWVNSAEDTSPDAWNTVCTARSKRSQLRRLSPTDTNADSASRSEAASIPAWARSCCDRAATSVSTIPIANAIAAHNQAGSPSGAAFLFGGAPCKSRRDASESTDASKRIPMTTLERSTLYRDHLQTVRSRADVALERAGREHLVVPSGTLHYQAFDDRDYPYAVNPQFKAWVPLTRTPGSWIVYTPGQRPKLLYLQPRDYWHVVPRAPAGYWVPEFDIVVIRTAEEALQHLPPDASRCAILGEPQSALGGWIPDNPPAAIAYLEYHR